MPLPFQFILWIKLLTFAFFAGLNASGSSAWTYIPASEPIWREERTRFPVDATYILLYPDSTAIFIAIATALSLNEPVGKEPSSKKYNSTPNSLPMAMDLFNEEKGKSLTCTLGFPSSHTRGKSSGNKPRYVGLFSYLCLATSLPVTLGSRTLLSLFKSSTGRSSPPSILSHAYTNVVPKLSFISERGVYVPHCVHRTPVTWPNCDGDLSTCLTCIAIPHCSTSFI